MRTLRALRLDLRLQWRQGFYGAYLFVIVVYVVILRALPPDVRGALLAPVLLSEAGVIGFIFAGTLLHRERGDGTLSALAVTPLTAAEYVTAKALSLAVLTAAASCAIAAGALGAPFLQRGAGGVPLLAAATAATALLFVCAGLAVATRFATIDRFVVWGGLGTGLLGLAILPHFGIAESPAWLLLPSTPLLALMAAATHAPLPPMLMLLHALLATLWIGAAFMVGRRWVAQHTASL